MDNLISTKVKVEDSGQDQDGVRLNGSHCAPIF